MNPELIQGSGVFTKEMKELLLLLNQLIEYSRQAGRKIEQIQLNKKQWEPIRKDRKRHGWKTPRDCGFIHYENSEPSFDGVALRAPSTQDFIEYIQVDAFK